MEVVNKLVLILAQWFGYLWHLVVFVLLIPVALFLLSDGLDYLVFRVVLGTHWTEGISADILPLYNLFAFTVVAFGILVIAESALTLYKEARTFPFAHLPHAKLRPAQLATGGWYARVRHPMLFGYLATLLGVGLILQSPAMVFWWVPLLGGVTLVKTIITEERSLKSWFGDEYVHYQKTVPAIIPRLLSFKKLKS